MAVSAEYQGRKAQSVICIMSTLKVLRLKGVAVKMKRNLATKAEGVDGGWREKVCHPLFLAGQSGAKERARIGEQ